MALTISLSYSNETKSGTTYLGTLTDSTTYGGANPARSAGAFYVSGEKLKSDGTLDEAIVFSSYDQEVDTTYTFTIPKDGWHQFYAVFIRDYDNGATYNQYDVVYQDSNNLVYRALSNGITGIAPPNVTYWEVISSPTALIDNVDTASESTSLEYQIYNRVLYPNAKTFAGTASAAAAINGCSDCERSEDVLVYEQAVINVDALNNYDARSQHALGEEIARASDEFIAEHS